MIAWTSEGMPTNVLFIGFVAAVAVGEEGPVGPMPCAPTGCTGRCDGSGGGRVAPGNGGGAERGEPAPPWTAGAAGALAVAG